MREAGKAWKQQESFPQTQLGRTVLLLFPALSATLLVGDCTANFAPGGVDPWVPVAAASVATSSVLLVGVLLVGLLRAGITLTLWSFVSGSTCLGMVAAVRAAGSSDSIAAFFVVNLLVAFGVCVAAGILTSREGLTLGRVVVVAFVSLVAVLLGQGVLVWAYFASADVCIAMMGNTCSNPDPFLWVRFSVMAGSGTSFAAFLPALAMLLLNRHRNQGV